jgi:hypothetical protein
MKEERQTAFISDRARRPEFIYLRLSKRRHKAWQRALPTKAGSLFCAHVKSDLSGLAEADGGDAKLEARTKEVGFKLEYRGYPASLWDLFGELGHPICATVSEMGRSYSRGS